MKYIHAFRDPERGRHLLHRLAAEADPDRLYRLMEFCGGHTHAIFRYGLQQLLPDPIRMIHGPGCPVCVLPSGRLDMALELLAQPDMTLCTYADMLRVPGSRQRSLQQARAEGADVRMVYSCLEALAIAAAEPQRQVVFLAIGFETTTPPTAVALRQAQAQGLRNFTVLCNHVLTPAAIAAILHTQGGEPGIAIDGLLGPAHVSLVIGTRPYEFCARTYAKPVVISGFEPLDILQSILMLVRQLNQGHAVVDNQYTRAVSPQGNVTAQALMAEVFELRSTFEWRGLGHIPHSALQLRSAYADFDAERRFGVVCRPTEDHRACRCPSVLRGVAQPTDCPLFGHPCNPQNPLGACMVSDEGACAAYYHYARRMPTEAA